MKTNEADTVALIAELADLAAGLDSRARESLIPCLDADDEGDVGVRIHRVCVDIARRPCVADLLALPLEECLERVFAMHVVRAVVTTQEPARVSTLRRFCADYLASTEPEYDEDEDFKPAPRS